MAWYNTNWTYRKKITIDNTKVSANLTDFPVYVDLSDLGTDFFSNVNIGGGDIRITKADGTTELARELVSISNELQATSGSWASGADTIETVPANSDGEIFFTVNYDKNSSANYFMGGFSAEADTPAAGYTDIDFAIYGSPNATLQVYENGTQVHNTGSAPTAGDIVSVNRNGSTGAITYKKNGTTFYTSSTTTTAELKGDISVNNISDYISNITLYDGTKTFYPSFDNLVNMTHSQIGELHFKGDALNSTTDTEFYIYYGNAAASDYAVTDTYGRNNVWSSYDNVYHMQEDPSGTAPQIIDSTSNNRDGTSAGSMTSADLVNGQLGKSLDFDGSDDYLSVSSFGKTSTSHVTVEAWVRPDVTNVNHYIVDESGTASYGGGLMLRIKNDSGVRFWQQDAGWALNSASSLTAGNFYYLVGVYDGTKQYIYIDGVEDVNNTLGAQQARNAANPRIGSSNLLGGPVNGLIDEVRISGSARSADWISTQYKNQNSASTFYSLGAQETNQINIVSISPAHESTGNAVDTNLVITYDQNATAGTGSLTITQRDGLIIGDGFAGKIGELILTNENLSQDTIEKVEGYLAWKWFGINNPLPDSHPYKLRRPVI